MAGKIFVKRDGEQLISLSNTRYENEDLFQGMIADYPDILAGDQISPSDPRRWILISREMQIPFGEAENRRFSLDHLFVDQDAVPTFVEVKRSEDSRTRREWVGQMLDYAANAVQYWSIDDIRELYDENVISKTTLSLSEFGIEDESKFWHDVSENLREGKVRLMFVADEIPTELQTVFEFLNDKMGDTEVLGLEIKQYLSIDGSTITFVPNLVGRTARNIQARGSKPQNMDEQSFLAQAAKISGDEIAGLCEKILRYLETLKCDLWWGKGSSGSFIPVFGKSRYQIFGVYNSSKNTFVELQFQYMREPFDTLEYREKMQSAFNKIPGVNIPDDRLHKRPSFPVDYLEKEETYALFIDAIKEYHEDVMRYEESL